MAAKLLGKTLVTRLRFLCLTGILLGGSLVPCTRQAFSAPETRESVIAPEAGTKTRIEALLQQSHDLEGSETKAALEKAREALGLARQASDRPLELRCLLQLGIVLRLLDDYPGSTAAVKEGLDLAETVRDDHTRGEFFILRGLIEWNQARGPESTVSMMEAFRLGEATGDDALRVGALYGRGLVRGRRQDLDGALADLNAALQIAEKNGDARLGLVLNSLGVIYLKKKDYPSARTALERALAVLQAGTNRRTTAYAQLNLGEVATATGDQETAGRYLDTAMATCQRYGFRRGIADIHYLQAARLRRLGQPDEAIKQLDLSVELAQQLNNPDLFVLIYEEYIQVEQARGDYRAALEYNRKLADTLEVVRGEKSRREAAEIQARYEAERHVQEIKILQRGRDLEQAQLTMQATQLSQAKSYYTLLIITMILGGITLAALASRQRVHARLARRMLAETQAAKDVVEAADACKAELLTVAARDLRESEDRFRNAFEHSALGMAMVALDGRSLRVNAALCRMLGYPADELLATDFRSITHPEDLEADLQLTGRLVAGLIEDYSLEKRCRHREGHYVWVRLDVSLLRHPEDRSAAYFIAQVDDITERRRAREQLRLAKEAAEKANEAKNGFLSRMSHELRTPLNAILGFSQLLENDDLGERQNQSVGHICSAGRHLLDLINEVLDIAQIESGQLRISTEPTSLEDALRGAVSLMEPLAHEAGLEICPWTPPADTSVYIRADPRRLRQIILNLLSNAIKYNRPQGKVFPRYTVTGGTVRLEIVDTGVGIDGGQLETIFTPFTRLAATENIEGSGLGLSVTKALTEAMGGRLGVTSEPGVGSNFMLEFAALSEAEAAQEPLPVLEAIPSEFYGEPVRDVTVLYVEDIAENVELVRYIFETMHGIHLVSAGTGHAGIELARTCAPDLILLDLQLPDMPGAAVLAQLRREPALAQVPVIVMSADASMSQAETLRSLGACEYLTHPFDLKQFRRLVEDTILTTKPA